MPQTPLSLASVPQSPIQTRCSPDHFAQVDPCLDSNVTLSPISPSEVLVASSGPQLPTQIRPNSSLQFPQFSNTPLPSSNANVLNPQGIATLLRHYPNQRFVDTLVSIALKGVTVGYTGSPTGQTRRPNHASTSVHPDVITKSIQFEIDAGRVTEITDLPANYFCSPLGLTPKLSNGVQTGWRTIFDLSSPEGSAVNDGIPKEFGSIVYETIDDALRLIAQAGKDAILMKRDLKSAFRHIPISPCDHWLLIFEWQGHFYVDMFLPFGLRTAP